MFVESSPTELLQAHETIEAMSSEIEDLKAELMELKVHLRTVERKNVGLRCVINPFIIGMD